MLLKDISFNTPEENLLYDDVLLRLAEEGKMDEVLRFWESEETFIVLGRISRLEEDVKIEAAIRDGIPILRRSSGGGTVLQGRGCLNYSLILSKEWCPALEDLRKSYQMILDKVIIALGGTGIDAVFQPLCDVALRGQEKKISGNAQKRGRKFILHHGTILCRFDLETIEKYLAVPKSVPPYRRGRPHREFVANTLRRPKDMKNALVRAFGAAGNVTAVTQEEKACLSRFLVSRPPAVDIRLPSAVLQ